MTQIPIRSCEPRIELSACLELCLRESDHGRQERCLRFIVAFCSRNIRKQWPRQAGNKKILLWTCSWEIEKSEYRKIPFFDPPIILFYEFGEVAEELWAKDIIW